MAQAASLEGRHRNQFTVAQDLVKICTPKIVLTCSFRSLEDKKKVSTANVHVYTRWESADEDGIGVWHDGDTRGRASFPSRGAM